MFDINDNVTVIPVIYIVDCCSTISTIVDIVWQTTSVDYV